MAVAARAHGCSTGTGLAAHALHGRRRRASPAVQRQCEWADSGGVQRNAVGQTVPRQAPVSVPRSSTNFLKRSRSPLA